MRKKYKTWIQQLSESYIRQNLQEAQQPPPMFPGGNPPPQPLPEPSRPIDIPPMEPRPTRPLPSAAMRSGQTPPPPKKGPGGINPNHTQELFWNGQYWVVHEFDENGNLIYNYVWDGKEWVQVPVPGGGGIYRPRKNNITQNEL
jgi:hypothetical protein